MKKVLFFLALSIFFIQCSTNNDHQVEEQPAQPENLAVSITIEGDYLNENRQKSLYISSEEGIIEGQLALVNNQENLLTIQKEPNTNYLVIIHDKLSYNGWTRHDFSIFENLESSDFTINANPNSIGNSGDWPKVQIYMENIGNLSQIGRTGGVHASLSSANGGTFTSNGTCLSNPGDYYASYKKQEEPFARYFWTEDVDEDESFSLNYEELPMAPVVETHLPEHESASVSVYGYRSDYPSVGHTLSQSSTQGSQIHESYLPEEAVFDLITFNTSLYKGATVYSFYSVSEGVPSSIEMPSFDFNINDFSVENTKYTTTGNYDISNSEFIITDDNSTALLIVRVYSEQKSTVSTSMTTLIDSLLEELPSLDATQLEPNNIRLSSSNYWDSYEEAVQGLIEGTTPRVLGNYRETVSRKNN